MLAACPKWITDGDTVATSAGTNRHAALHAILTQEPTSDPPNEYLALDDSDRESVQWAADYVRLKAPMSEYPLECERKDFFVGPDFTRIEGTPDVVCGNHVFDLKSRQRDYTAQMAAYSLMRFERLPGAESVTVHLMYTESRRVQVLEFDREAAEAIVQRIQESVTAPEAGYTPCDYCGWCGARITCPALVARAGAVANGREDWHLEQYHSSQIDDPAEMGKALRMARHLADWCEAVEHRAKEMAIKDGKVPVGFKIQTRQGNRFIPDIKAAFAVAGLPQDEFLAACDVKFSALVDRHAAINGMKKAPAEREMERRLGDALQRKSPSVSLVAEKPF
jgi:hypothetical protein